MRSEFHAHPFLEFYLGLVFCVSASAVDAERKLYHFHMVGDDALPDVANNIKNVFKAKLKLDSPLSESDRRGSQLQFCWTHISREAGQVSSRSSSDLSLTPL